MKQEDVAEIMAKPISQRLLTGKIPARFAYTGADGDPRVIPIAFLWNGRQLIVGTAVASAKVRALRQNPRVAITIDTEGQYPPNALLVRGTANLEVVDGVPEEYLEASRKLVPDEAFEGWKTGVCALYDQMVRITIEPDWAKLLDFETTIPKAVEDLVLARQG